MPDGATVALGGFSVGHRFALGLITALRDKGAKNLCLVCNSMGAPGELRGQVLAELATVATADLVAGNTFTADVTGAKVWYITSVGKSHPKENYKVQKISFIEQLNP